MGELRDEIIGILNPSGFLGYRKFDEETADRILAIPAIQHGQTLRALDRQRHREPISTNTKGT